MWTDASVNSNRQQMDWQLCEMNIAKSGQMSFTQSFEYRRLMIWTWYDRDKMSLLYIKSWNIYVYPHSI